MKDIQSLYTAAKTSGTKPSIDAYVTEVTSLLENSPGDYMSNLEYIISSSVGLKTFKPFIERYGLSLAGYNQFMVQLEAAIKKCSMQGKDASAFKEAVVYLEAYKQSHRNAFIMYENFSNTIDKAYLPFYYERKAPLINYVEKLYPRYGAAILPDMIIEAANRGNEALTQLTDLLRESGLDPIIYQWLTEAYRDILKDASADCVFENYSLDAYVAKLMQHRNDVFREAALMQDDNAEISFTEGDLNAVRDLITFKEYFITCYEDANQIIQLQEEVYALYEAFGDFLEDTVETVLPQLPINEEVGGAKKTSDIPGYIKKHHDVSKYGEEPMEGEVPKPGTDDDKSLEDFRRPSADSNTIPSSDLSLSAGSSSDELKSDITTAATPEEQQKAINNYYYYTYTNSFNKKKHEDRSVDNSHRINNKNINNSQRTIDDHSVGKRIKSDNTNTPVGESVLPDFNLNIIEAVMESADNWKGYWDRERTVFNKVAGEKIKEYIKYITDSIPTIIEQNKRELEGIADKRIQEEIISKLKSN